MTTRRPPLLVAPITPAIAASGSIGRDAPAARGARVTGLAVRDPGDGVLGSTLPVDDFQIGLEETPAETEPIRYPQ